ncbi:MAG: IS982 family transposase [Actinobacteria bacterium]|nr:IS982 family transposase [Actinomycetota bacterium]
MDDTITTIYCSCDEFLKAIGHRDDPQVHLSTAEVMTVPLVAATFFGGNTDETRSFLSEYGYMPDMISKSRLNRRLHAIELVLWQGLFALLAELFKQRNAEQTYVVDSLAVPVCDNIRIRRCRLYPPEESAEAFRGYISSKRRYFYGLRVHLVVSGAGEPVEFALEAGSEADVGVFKNLGLDLPEGSTILADKAYTDYDYEDLLEEAGLHLKAQRKKNSKRPVPAWEEFLGKPIRQYIETVFSRLTSLFARKIHAVTPRGFELKIVWFLLAFSIQCL